MAVSAHSVSQRRVRSMRGHGRVGHQDGHAAPYPWALFVFARSQQGKRPGPQPMQVRQATASQATCAKPLRRQRHDIGFAWRTRLSASGVREPNLRIRRRLNRTLSAERTPVWRDFDSAYAGKVSWPFEPPSKATRSTSPLVQPEKRAPSSLCGDPRCPRSLSRGFLRCLHQTRSLARFVALRSFAKSPA